MITEKSVVLPGGVLFMHSPMQRKSRNLSSIQVCVRDMIELWRSKMIYKEYCRAANACVEIRG